MGAVQTVRAQFMATAAGFKSTIQGIVKDTKRIGTETESSVKRANTGLGSFGSTIAKVGGAYVAFQGITNTLGFVGKATIGANADMETYHDTLTTLMKSSDKASETLNWAEKFAGTTPFEIPEIVDATAKLTAYGINAQDVMGGIGDMAAIMGKPLSQAVEAVADAQTGELERLKEFGITKGMLIDKAQEMYGVEIVNAKGQITDMDKLNGALMGIMKERYAGGMETASKSFKGMVSNVKDSMGTIMREMGKPIFEKLKTGLTSLTPIMGAAVQAMRGDWVGLKETLGGAFGAETALAIENFFLLIGLGINNAKQYIASFKPVIENLKTIFVNLAPIATTIFDGLKLAIGGIIIALPPLLTLITDIAAKITSWGGFIPLITMLGTTFIAFKTIMFGITKATAAYNIVLGLMTTAKRAARAATLAYAIAGGGARGVMLAMRAAAIQLNLAMLANPIVLIIALIAGLIAVLILAYKKSETFRNIVDGMWAAIKSGFTAALAWLGNFFTVTIPAMWASAMAFFSNMGTWLSNFFAKWGTTILAVLVPFLGIPLLIYQKWDTIKAFLAAVWNSVVATVMPIVNGFIAGIVGIFNKFMSVIMPIVTGFVNAVKTSFTNFKNNMMTIISPLINFFKKTWENIKLLVLGIVGVFLNLLLGRFGDVKLSLLAIWTAIKNQTMNIINTFKAVALAVFTLFVSGIKNMFTIMKNSAIAIWNALKSGSIAVFNALKSGVIAIVNGIKTGAINAWNALKSGAIAAVNGLKTGAIAAFNHMKSGVINIVNGIKSGIVNTFNSAKALAIGAFNLMSSTISNVIGKIKGFVTGMKTSIVSTIKGISLKQIGADIMNGLLNGISNGAKAVYDKANEIADGIKDKIKKALKIKSPSRVMEDEVGEEVGAGAIVGMDNMRGKVMSMAAKLSSAMRTPFNANVLGKVGSSVMESVQTIRHTIDLTNVPAHIDESMLANLLMKSVNNPKIQKAIDRINYKNVNGSKLPQGS